MRRHPVVAWVSLAALGIVIAAAITIEASRLAHPNVGLSSEPPYVGAALSPVTSPIRPAPPRRKRGSGATTAAPRTASGAAPALTIATTGAPSAPGPLPQSAPVPQGPAAASGPSSGGVSGGQQRQQQDTQNGSAGAQAQPAPSQSASQPAPSRGGDGEKPDD